MCKGTICEVIVLLQVYDDHMTTLRVSVKPYDRHRSQVCCSELLVPPNGRLQ